MYEAPNDFRYYELAHAGDVSVNKLQKEFASLLNRLNDIFIKNGIDKVNEVRFQNPAQIRSFVEQIRNPKDKSEAYKLLNQITTIFRTAKRSGLM